MRGGKIHIIGGRQMLKNLFDGAAMNVTHQRQDKAGNPNPVLRILSKVRVTFRDEQ